MIFDIPKPLLTGPAIVIKQEEPKPPTTYTIKEGDTLTTISELNRSSVARLWQKNTELTNPDLITPGDTLTIPQEAEQLVDRPLPESVIVKASLADTTSPQINSGGSLRPAVAGNLYEAGQCTWYVKNRRPDIPNNWGNASDWLYNAQAQGWSTGSTPRVGAIGWTSGHVVYIEAVNGDQVTYSDMNGNWVPFEKGSDTVPASRYTYIY